MANNLPNSANLTAGISEIDKLRQDNLNGRLAKNMGVPKAELDQTLDALEKSFKQLLKRAESFAPQLTAENIGAIRTLEKEGWQLDKDLNKVTSFARSTVAGRTIRLIAAGAAILNAYQNIKELVEKPDAVKGLRTADVSLIALQQTSEMLVSLGIFSPSSAVGTFAKATIGGVPLGEYGALIGESASKKIGGVLLSDLLMQAYVALEAIDALRFTFGIGVERDTGAAVLSATSAAGLGIAAFGESSWAGPVGWATAALTIAGKHIYDGVKDAHKYEEASEIALKAAGFKSLAAAAFSRRSGYMSPVSGASQISFLAKYAHYRGMTMDALRVWINALPDEQVKIFSDNVLSALDEGLGDPTRHRPQWVGAGLQDKNPGPKVSPEEAARRLEAIEMGVFEHTLVRDKVSSGPVFK